MSAPMEDDGVDYEEEVEEDEEEDVPDVIDMNDLEAQGLQPVDVDALAPDGPEEEDDDNEDEEPEKSNEDTDEQSTGIVLMEPERCDAIRILKGHTSPVHSLALNPTSSLLVSGGEDDTAYVWDWQKGDMVHTLKGHTDTVISTAFSFDGKLIITGSMEGCVKIWDAESGNEVCSMTDLSDGVEWIIAHPKGPIVFGGGSAGQSCMWNTKGECMQTFWGHADKVTCGSLSGDGRLLVTGSSDGTVKVFSPQSGEVLHTIDKESAKNISGEEISCLATTAQNAEVLIVGLVDGTMIWLNPKNGKVYKAVQEHQNSVETIDFSPTQPLMASGDADGTIIVWDTATQNVRYKLALGEPVPKLLWVDEKLVYVSINGAAFMRDGRTKDDVDTITWLGHKAAIQNAVVTREPPCVITCGDDNDIQVYSYAK
eukprot:TRINITY_DN35133_c0_g1_i1.p1 TRINITY_DN35133_c0_g1~~TRINITY_DN35133_c0_g1_i1.p1  ORF type:complete len:426 (-),score=60.34 TRINITY_DN35133_c0_g1_i1:127-1404(-)